MQKDGRTHGGTYTWRRYTNDETTKKGTVMEGTYIRRGHTHGEDTRTERAYTEGTCIRREVHMKGEGYTQHIQRGRTYRGEFTWRDTYKGVSTHGGTKCGGYTEGTFALNRLCSCFELVTRRPMYNTR